MTNEQTTIAARATEARVAAWADTIVSGTAKVDKALAALRRNPSPTQRADANRAAIAAMDAVRAAMLAADAAALKIDLYFELGRRGYGK